MLLAASYPNMEGTHDLFLLMYRCCSYNIVIITSLKQQSQLGNWIFKQNKMIAVYHFREKGTELIVVNDERGFSSNFNLIPLKTSDNNVMLVWFVKFYSHLR